MYSFHQFYFVKSFLYFSPIVFNFMPHILEVYPELHHKASWWAQRSIRQQKSHLFASWMVRANMWITE